MENSESRHLVSINVYCLHSKNRLGRRALICLYPEIKDNAYVKSHKKGNTQYMRRAPDAALPRATPGVATLFFYSRMHSLCHLFIQIFIEKRKYARNFYLIFGYCFLCLGILWNLLLFLKPYCHCVKNIGSEQTARLLHNSDVTGQWRNSDAQLFS